jgi:hypothetical protein
MAFTVRPEGSRNARELLQGWGGEPAGMLVSVPEWQD